ncbi:MAG: pyridoxal phosphate-dependent aminotransferase [Gammaproteobacteria bacterium]|nr:pyridoxal phosphate-dependent aminotransferase [Gammaproteobacteria bacterium]
MDELIKKIQSKRVYAVQTPIIPTITQLARKHSGTISLGQGVAYYGPPQQAYDEIQKQLNSNKLNAYGPVEGIPELTQTLAEKLHARNNISINQKSKVFVTAGSNMAFSSLMVAIADPGDEIILLTPYYFNHEMAIRLADATPVLVPTLDNYHPDIDHIKSTITNKTRAIVTVSPNNPTGAVYTQEELTAINQLCAKHGIYHISDEAYEDFLYEDRKHFSPASLNNSEAHTISLYSLSKAYGFAGWRVGYMVIPSQMFASLRKVQDTVLISPTIISQYAAHGAHRAPYSYIENHLKEIEKSRDVCLEHINQTNLLKTPAVSEGAFYIFIKLNTKKDDFTIAKQLIEKFGVATIPGSAFEASNGAYLRISYGALTSATVKQGIEKLTAGLQILLI